MATSIGTTASAAVPVCSTEREWRGSDGSCRISINNKTLEQIRFEVSRAMNGPGAQGVGGVLLGTRLGTYFRITGYQAIPCEHALGPDFRLAGHEERRLKALLDELRTGAGSEVQQPLGWLVSHPRGDLRITEEESRLHRAFFAGGQLVMIAKPDRLGEMELAVHHAQDGAESTVRLVEPVLSVVPDASFRPIRRSASARRQAAELTPALSATPGASRTAAGTPAPATFGRKNLLVSALLAILLVSVCAVFYWDWQRTKPRATVRASEQAPIEMLSLHAYEDRGRFYISWNGDAEAIKRAASIVLLIQDGGKTNRYEMTSGEASSGVRIHPRIGVEVKVTLEVRGADGHVVEESTHYTSSDFSPPSLLRAAPDEPSVEFFDPSAISPEPPKN